MGLPALQYVQSEFKPLKRFPRPPLEFAITSFDHHKGWWKLDEPGSRITDFVPDSVFERAGVQPARPETAVAVMARGKGYVPPHRDPFGGCMLIILESDGACHLQVEGQSSRCAAGDVLLFNDRRLHSFMGRKWTFVSIPVVARRKKRSEAARG